MMVAQQLYEGIELPGEEAAVGLITYMRTDSVRVSDDALTEAREHIREQYGDAYLPEQANRYKIKANAQDAHEAIRPTSMALHAGIGAAASLRRPVLHLSADLEPVRRLADDAGGLRRHDGGYHRAAATTPSAPRARCRSSRAGSPSTARRRRRSRRASARSVRRRPRRRTWARRQRRRRGERRAAGAPRRADARVARDQAGAEVHAAAGAIQRSDARQGARRGRHRPAEHLRVDHLGAAGARLREQGRGPLPADDSRPAARRQAAAPGASTTSSTSSTRRAWRSSSTTSRRARPTTRRR